MYEKILLIDDEYEFALAVKNALEGMHYSVKIANNGFQAIKFLETDTYELVLSDVLMPDMDGIELAIHILKNFKRQKLIMMSGGGRLSREFYLHTAKKLGVKHVIPKPFSISQLEQTIQACLSGN